MSTGRKQAFWNKQPIYHCPICNKPYKSIRIFYNHLEYFHKLGYQGAMIKAHEYFSSLSEKGTEQK